MSIGEFSVVQFFPDGGYERVRSCVGAEEAVLTAKSYTERPAALAGIICRVIITDGGDNIAFEWKFGQGVVWPPPAPWLKSKAETSNSKERTVMYRQGDVLIVPVAKLPEKLEPVAREGGRVVLAQGEVTGHAHAIKDKRAALFRDPKLATLFMQVTGDKPVALAHDEHDTISVPPGSYQVIRQREYSPEAIRNVAD